MRSEEPRGCASRTGTLSEGNITRVFVLEWIFWVKYFGSDFKYLEIWHLLITLMRLDCLNQDGPPLLSCIRPKCPSAHDCVQHGCFPEARLLR
jgi:hypothetical protein